MQLALSDFCRVPSEFVSQLTLVRQLPGVPKEMFLSSPKCFSVSGCPTACRVGYAFCPDCLHEAARMGHPAYIPAVWSLALLTHCRVHLRPLQSHCPVCLVEEPLLFPSPPKKSGFFCRSWVLGSNGTKCGAPHFAPNPECNKIRSRVGERALGGDFITICSAFSQRREEGEQSIVSLESGDSFAGRG
jgi:hypothetical protein